MGNSCVIASCALLAGYVEVEDQAFISGGVAIHQFSRVGRALGLNRVGLLMLIGSEDLPQLKEACRILYSSGLKMEQALSQIEE